ncbi:MAG: ATP-binding cassette domain-containing protein [Pseudomonadota bacterium]
MSLLRVANVSKSFGPVSVLHGVDMSVGQGEVIGLVGDNGAGKSTLMKIVTGMYTADTGEIELNGESILHHSPGERRRMGIEMIYQDLALARQQDVSANIFLGREPQRKILGMSFVDRARMRREAQAMIDRLGARLPAINRPVGSFSGGQQQSVAIARALTFDPQLVIMDEPTAALAVREVQSVLNLIRQLKSEGIGVILISHRLNDVLSVTDRIVVLNHGRAAANLTTSETDMTEVVSSIVGGAEVDDAATHEAIG